MQTEVKTKYDVFISYRREGGYETAKHIYDLLSKDGYSVSFDIDTLRSGDFDVQIYSRIDECQDFILVLDKHAFDRTLDPSFPKDNDWLRLELAYALVNNKNIIPIMLSGFTFPNKLPTDVDRVRYKNSPAYVKEYFDSFYIKLKSFLKSAAAKILNSSSKVVLKVKSDVNCAVYVDDEWIVDIEKNKTHRIYLEKGTYILKVVSKLLPLTLIEKEYKVMDSSMNDLLNINAKDYLLSSLREKQILSFQENGKFGFKYRNEIIVEATYDGAGNFFSEGLAVVKLHGKYGVINLRGESITPFKYDEIDNFYNGYASVKLRNKWGFINKKGMEITALKYDILHNFSEGFAAVNLNGMFGFIDTDGCEITKIEYNNVSESFSDGLAGVQRGLYWGFINTLGKEVIPAMYQESCEALDSFYDFNRFRFSEGLARIEQNGKCGFINKKGEVVIPAIYENANPFSEGLASVKLEGKWGFINTYGYNVIPFEYSAAGNFSEGLVSVRRKIRWGFINKKGYDIIAFEFSTAYRFVNGYAIVGLNQKYGFVDIHGNLLTPIKYDNVKNFSKDYAPICLNYTWGEIDKNGTEYWNEE